MVDLQSIGKYDVVRQLQRPRPCHGRVVQSIPTLKQHVKNYCTSLMHIKSKLLVFFSQRKRQMTKPFALSRPSKPLTFRKYLKIQIQMAGTAITESECVPVCPWRGMADDHPARLQRQLFAQALSGISRGPCKSCIKPHCSTYSRTGSDFAPFFCFCFCFW